MTIQDSAEAGKAAVRGVTAPNALPELSFDLVLRPERKVTRLLQNSGSTEPLSGKHKRFEYDFSESIFAINVVIDTAGYAGNAFVVGWRCSDGTEKIGNVVREGNQFVCEILDHVTSVFFTPPKAFFSDPTLNHVQLHGFKTCDIRAYLDYALNVEKIAQDALSEIDIALAGANAKIAQVEALQALRGSLSQDIAKFKTQSTSEQGKLKRITTEYNELIAKKGEIDRSISDEYSRLINIKSEISKYSATRTELAKRIIIKRENLSQLEANINLFPSEISGFSEQGSRDTWLYSKLAALPIICIAFVLGLLVFGSAKLTTEIVYDKNLNIAAMLASRTPYVMVCLGVISTCYYLSRMFVLEIIRVNRQKLNLTKISIIAKDISYSIDHDLNFSDQEKYNYRLQLKMSLMTDHLKDYLTKDFTPTLPRNPGIGAALGSTLPDK